jgi:hypothetical protein
VAFLFVIDQAANVTCNINCKLFYPLPINEALLTLWQRPKHGNFNGRIIVKATVFGTFHAG